MHLRIDLFENLIRRPIFSSSDSRFDWSRSNEKSSLWLTESWRERGGERDEERVCECLWVSECECVSVFERERERERDVDREIER